MKNWPAANTIDRNSVDEIRPTRDGSGAHGAREKAQQFLRQSGVAKPSNVGSDTAGLVQWQKRYGELWKLKIAFEKKHNR